MISLNDIGCNEISCTPTLRSRSTNERKKNSCSKLQEMASKLFKMYFEFLTQNNYGLVLIPFRTALEIKALFLYLFMKRPVSRVFYSNSF